MSKPCSADDFKQVITDWGVCYTFNDPENISEARMVNRPGNTNGLFLRLNVEQYEYIYGEDSAAGIKVRIIYTNTLAESASKPKKGER